MYFVNDYKFLTKSHRSIKSTSNYGVCVKGSNSSDTEIQYDGRLIEVLKLEYSRLPIKHIVLLKCEWFDPTINSGMKVHKQYPLVDVNLKQRLIKYELFILAMQAAQVYYVSYLSLKIDKFDWLDVSKVKARIMVDVPNTIEKTINGNIAFQEDELFIVQLNEASIMIDELGPLNDVNGELVEFIDDEAEISDDLILESELEDESEDEDAEVDDSGYEKK